MFRTCCRQINQKTNIISDWKFYHIYLIFHKQRLFWAHPLRTRLASTCSPRTRTHAATRPRLRVRAHFTAYPNNPQLRPKLPLSLITSQQGRDAIDVTTTGLWRRKAVHCARLWNMCGSQPGRTEWNEYISTWWTKAVSHGSDFTCEAVLTWGHYSV